MDPVLTRHESDDDDDAAGEPFHFDYGEQDMADRRPAVVVTPAWQCGSSFPGLHAG
jgi:hypothetical protein